MLERSATAEEEEDTEEDMFWIYLDYIYALY